MNPLRRAARQLTPQRAFHAPGWVVLGVNNVCNLHCRMCDVGTGADSNFAFHLTGAEPLNMPLDLLTDTLDQVAAMWPRAKVGWAFTEPSVYPHLLPSLQHARRLGLHTTMTTNGLQLPKIASGLREAGLRELFVSLDGPAEVHDRVRRREGAFDRAMEGIRLTKGGPRVSVFACVTPWNVRSFRRLWRALDGIPLTIMHTNFTTPEMAERHNARFAAYPATASNVAQMDVAEIDLDALWEEIRDLPVTFSPDLRSRAALEAFYRGTAPIGKRCGDVWRSVMIKSDGSVIPAHGRCYRVTMGNVRTQTLASMWNGSEVGELRRTLTKAGGLLPACVRCCSAFER